MPSGTNGSERHRSRSGERGRRDRGHGLTGLRDVTNRQGSITRLGIERVGSGPSPRLRREGPAPGPSRLM